ncbi:unnamed protein product [marine sediment metagenome]|uniref:Tyr recombinase domain-containing protein n=1 Tax=marine sediment metagenome TaxID=412755 RepID=X1RWC7_9ZZZZ
MDNKGPDNQVNNRDLRGRFVKGVSGNPKGKPVGIKDFSISDLVDAIKEGKYGVDRTVNFSDYTAELLKQYKKQRSKSDYLFCTLKGNKLSRKYLYNMARRYAKRVQINKLVGLHTLRHSFALKYYQDSNHDLFGLQKILGHSRVSSTQIYCYIDNTHVKKGLESFYSKRDKGNDSKDKNIEEKIKTLEEEIQNLKSRYIGI